MERRIGETFTYKGKTYQVVKDNTLCTGCAFLENSACRWLDTILGSCYRAQRTDHKGVIFKEINNMEIKDNTLTIEIPKGMEVDTENSDLAKGIIKFKNKVLSYKTVYNEVCNKSFIIDSHREDEYKLRAISRLMNIARYYNKDWKPDWEHREIKYYIYFDNNNNEYDINYNDAFCRNTIYFKNSEDAKAVIDNPNFRDILDAIYKK